jgi:hypothetical protein
MKDEKYSGWTNYATWRINLEILSDIEFDHPVTYDYVEELVEEVVFSQFDMSSGSHLIEDYARAFVSEVNFYEIADAINSDI